MLFLRSVVLLHLAALTSAATKSVFLALPRQKCEGSCSSTNTSSNASEGANSSSIIAIQTTSASVLTNCSACILGLMTEVEASAGALQNSSSAKDHVKLSSAMDELACLATRPTASNVARDWALHALSRALDVAAAALLQGLALGEQIAITSRVLSVSVSRTEWPPPINNSVGLLGPEGNYVSLTFQTSAAGRSGLDHDGMSIVVDSAAVPSGGLTAVDAVLVVSAINYFGVGEPPQDTVTVVASPVFSLKLLSSNTGIEIDVEGRGAITFDLGYEIDNSTAHDTTCNMTLSTCSAAVAELQARAEALRVHLQEHVLFFLHDGDYESSRRDLKSVMIELAEAHAACTPQCRGHGNCTIEGCQCESGWTGGQCESQRLCKYWDESNRTWSTQGCRTIGDISITPLGLGKTLCECDHLTSFGLLKDIVNHSVRAHGH